MLKLLISVLCLSIPLVHSAQQGRDAFEIARSGTVAEANSLLKSDPKAFNVTNERGFTPLILACYRGNTEVAKLLIQNGSDINANSGMGSPLMAAVVKGNNEIAKLLIQKDADLNLADANGTTALIYAVQFQNSEIVELLVKKNADKSKMDSKGKTAFEYAVFAGNQNIINLLK